MLVEPFEHGDRHADLKLGRQAASFYGHISGDFAMAIRDRFIGAATAVALVVFPASVLGEERDLGAAALQDEEAIVIFKYGENIDPEQAESAAWSLTYTGLPTQAAAGGSVANCVELQVNGEVVGFYTAEDLERKIGGAAWRAFDEKEFWNRHIGNCDD